MNLYMSKHLGLFFSCVDAHSLGDLIVALNTINMLTTPTFHVSNQTWLLNSPLHVQLPTQQIHLQNQAPDLHPSLVPDELLLESRSAQ